MSRSKSSKRQPRKLFNQIRDYKPTKKAKFSILSIFFAVVVIVYFTFSLQFTKSELLSDEIGYLTKAASIAGYRVDDASSYYAGYPIILSPLYLVLDSTTAIRVGVFFLNAVMFASSLVLLFFVLRKLFPKYGFTAIFASVAICSLYPSLIIMTGHVYANSAFLAVFISSLFVLLYLKESWLKSALLGFIVGFLTWIHPMGFAAIIALFLIIFYQGVSRKRYKDIVIYLITSVLVALAYIKGVHVFVNEAMTPKGYPSMDHYSEVIGRYKEILNPSSWLNALAIFLGRISYILIASFGVVVFGFVNFISGALSEVRNNRRLSMASLVFAYILLSLLIIAVISSMSLGTAIEAAGRVEARLPMGRIDHWLYGRYSDMVLLPLIGIGLLSKWRRKHAVVAAAFVLLVGVFLHFYVNNQNTNLINNFMVISITSFWPWAMYSGIGFLTWCAMGAAGIVVVSILRKKAAWLVAVPLMTLTIHSQGHWHNRVVFDKGNPPVISKLVKDSGSNVCIGTDPSMKVGTHQRNRLSLYSFYLYDTSIQRMTTSEWLESRCAMFFTDKPENLVDYNNVQVVAREDSTQLFLVAKTDIISALNVDDQGSLYFNHFYPKNDRCVLLGCFSRTVHNLTDFNFNYIIEGRLVGDQLITNGKEGYLFHGPYLPLKAGEYKLTLDGEFRVMSGAVIEIVSSNPTYAIAWADISKLDDQGGTVVIPFTLEEDVERLEIRLAVKTVTDLSFRGYSISPR